MSAVDGVGRLEEPGIGPEVSSESLSSESIVFIGRELIAIKVGERVTDIMRKL